MKRRIYSFDSSRFGAPCYKRPQIISKISDGLIKRSRNNVSELVHHQMYDADM